MTGMAISGAPESYNKYFKQVDNGDGRLSKAEARRAVRKFSKDNTAAVTRKHLVEYLGNKGYQRASLQKVSDRVAKQAIVRRGTNQIIPGVLSNVLGDR